MTGYTPEQIPVLNGLARGFGVFDHWFCEVPSQTLPNRSFWTAATSSGYVWNSPASKFPKHNDAETILSRSTTTAERGRSTVSEPHAALMARDDPLPAAQGSDRDARRAVRAVRDRCRERRPARLLAHRAEPGCRPQRLPPRIRSGRGQEDVPARCRPAVVNPRRRGVPLTDLRRLPGDAGHDGLQRLEHDAADRLGRARWHLRPRPAACRAEPGQGLLARRARVTSSTAPAIESRRSSCRPGSPKARCSTRSTGTHR